MRIRELKNTKLSRSQAVDSVTGASWFAGFGAKAQVPTPALVLLEHCPSGWGQILCHLIPCPCPLAIGLHTTFLMIDLYTPQGMNVHTRNSFLHFTGGVQEKAIHTTSQGNTFSSSHSQLLPGPFQGSSLTQGSPSWPKRASVLVWSFALPTILFHRCPHNPPGR